jgi:hypothetical protein
LVLCLDDWTFEALRQNPSPGLQPVRLADLEAWDPALAAARSSRSLIEYYFTLTPCICRWVLHLNATAEAVTYLDSDLFFFGNPQVVLDEMARDSVGIIAHRFAPGLESRSRYGRFNVGWITIRRDVNGETVLDWWRSRCLEWCRDEVDGERFAEQGYLNDWPTRFRGVRVIEYKGANVAPWNISRYEFSLRRTKPHVDDTPIVFFHVHGLRRVGKKTWWPQLEAYDVTLTKELFKGVYRPYVTALVTEEQAIARRPPPTVASGSLESGARSALRGASRTMLPEDVWNLLGTGAAMTQRWHQTALPLRAIAPLLIRAANLRGRIRSRLDRGPHSTSDV